jgi:ComF family protein
MAQMNWLKPIERIALPSICLLCAAPATQADTDLCNGCRLDLPSNQNACIRCAVPLGGSSLSRVCGACLRKPPRVAATHTGFRYEFPVNHLLRSLKYGGGLENSRVLGKLLAEHLLNIRRDDMPECVLPVPLGEARFRERGFNQATEIAHVVAHRMQLPLRTDVISRIRDTPVQAGLDRIARRKNLRNAFAVQQPFAFKHVAILDDVVTTGSTADELARVLLRAGANRVELWAVARVAL